MIAKSAQTFNQQLEQLLKKYGDDTGCYIITIRIDWTDAIGVLPQIYKTESTYEAKNSTLR